MKRQKKKKMVQYQSASLVVSRHYATPPTQKKDALRGKRRGRRHAAQSAGMAALPRRGAARFFPVWHLTRRHAVLLAVALTMLLASALMFLPQFRVQQADVTGTQRLSAADINAALDLSAQPVWMLRKSAVRRRLLAAYPSLADVQVSWRLFPAQVQITVTERQPLLAIQQNNGVYWADAEGVLFPARGTAAGVQSLRALSPLVQDGERALPAEMMQALNTVTAQLPPGAVLLYDAYHGLGWETSDGLRVFLGRQLDDIALKLRLYQAIQATLAGRGLHPVLIDVSYPQSPFYRLDD